QHGGLVVVPVGLAPVEAAGAGDEEEPEGGDDHGGGDEGEEDQEDVVVEGVGGLAAGARVEARVRRGRARGRCHLRRKGGLEGRCWMGVCVCCWRFSGWWNAERWCE